MLANFSELRILRAFIQHRIASKADLARYVGLTQPAVTPLVESLEERGYIVREAEKRRRGRGQPATLFRINDGAVFLGIHVGRNTLEFIAIGLTARVLKKKRYEFGFLNRDKLSKNCAQYLSSFIDSLKLSDEQLVGIGIATPYFWEGWGNELAISEEDTRNWDISIVKKLFNFPDGISIIVENDCSAAALGEFTFGDAGNYADFLYISISTFIGGGLILDGSLRTGAKGNSAALGPFPVSHSQLDSIKKNAGPFELLLRRASLNVLFNHLKHHGWDSSKNSSLTDLTPKLDSKLDEWIEDCSDALSQAIMGFWALVDVEVVIIDSPIPREILQKIIDNTNAKVDQYKSQGIMTTKLQAGTLADHACAYGAAAAIFEHLINGK